MFCSLFAVVVRIRTLPNNFVLKIILPENLVEHDLDVVAGVPVAVVIKAAGLFEDAGQFHAARAHVINVGLGRTSQQDVGIVRLLYGICGAALGIFFGLFSVWLVVVAIRSVGAIASAEIHNTQAEARPAPASAPLTAFPSPPPATPPPMIAALAKLKNSIELGPLGEAVKAVDVVPAQTYQTLGKVGTMVSNPQSTERFLSYPGAKELTENPRIIALRDDPEIIDLIKQQRFLDLLQHPKLIEAMNDPALVAQVKRFEFQKALDYAMKRN